MGERGITLVEIAAAVTIVGILVALLLPAWVCSSRFQKVLACEEMSALEHVGPNGEERLGDTGGRLHIERSRNRQHPAQPADQVKARPGPERRRKASSG